MSQIGARAVDAVLLYQFAECPAFFSGLPRGPRDVSLMPGEQLFDVAALKLFDHLPLCGLQVLVRRSELFRLKRFAVREMCSGRTCWPGEQMTAR